MAPEVGKTMRYTDKKGRTYTGLVEKIRRVRSGAVLAFLRYEANGAPYVKGCPVSTYGTWTNAE